jgi:hypothetical protein
MNNRVEKFIAELASLAKELCSEAEVRISTVSIEGEDANMDVIVPPEKYEEAHEILVHRAYEILLDEGYQIVVGVHDREELAARMGSAARAA